MLFGVLIDSTCRLWETDSQFSTCEEAGVSCLLFDTVQLRWRTYGVALAVQFVQLTFVVLLYFTIRRRRFHDDQLTLPVTSTTSPAADDDGPVPAPTFDELNLVEMTRTVEPVVD